MAEMLSPLAGREHAAEGAVRLSVQSPAAIVLIDGADAEAMGQVLGSRVRGIAVAPGRVALSGRLRVLASGPDQWLLVDDSESAAIWSERLERSLGPNTAVIDQTHSRVPIVLEGPAAAEVLLTGSPYEIDSMALGACTMTRLSHFHVLIEREAAERYRVFFTRSLALAGWDWLLQARAEFLM